jgi:hypothetical protein
MKEPKAKNTYGCNRAVWRRLGERERLHFNKLFADMVIHKEKYDPTEWVEFCKAVATTSAHLVARSRDIKVWRT